MKILPILLLTLLTTPAVEITAEPHHHLTLENPYVRVFNVEVPSGAETQMHWHRHDYVYVTIGPSTIVNNIEGRPTATLPLADGETRFSPGPFAHAVRTVSPTPFRNITVEILQDEKLRHASLPSPWKETRGLEILNHGTKEILFANNEVRATEYELQPDGMVPNERHTHPMLLIAVTDQDLFLNDPRVHDPHEPTTKSIHLPPGDSHWLPTGLIHPILNAAQHPAKFITLEFPN